MPSHQEIFERVAPTPGNCLFRPCDAPPVSAPIEILLDKTAREHGLSIEELTGGSRRRSLVAAKRALARKASVVHGHSLASIAKVLGCTPQAIHKLLSVPESAVDSCPRARRTTSPLGES